MIHSAVQSSTDIVPCAHLWNVTILFRDCVIHHVGIIVNRNLDTEQYRIIAVKAGILNDRYSRSQFDLDPQRLLGN